MNRLVSLAVFLACCLVCFLSRVLLAVGSHLLAVVLMDLLPSYSGFDRLAWKKSKAAPPEPEFPSLGSGCSSFGQVDGPGGSCERSSHFSPLEDLSCRHRTKECHSGCRLEVVAEVDVEVHQPSLE